MADLPTKKRTESTRIIGADPTTGDETNHAHVTANNDLSVSDRINDSGVQAELTVGTSAVAVRVGGSNLATRKVVTAMPKDNSVYWGYTNLVTTTTGTRIFKNQMVVWDIGPDLDIYLIADAAGKAVSISEGA
jgi:hypothetical protein